MYLKPWVVKCRSLGCGSHCHSGESPSCGLDRGLAKKSTGVMVLCVLACSVWEDGRLVTLNWDPVNSTGHGFVD